MSLISFRWHTLSILVLHSCCCNSNRTRPSKLRCMLHQRHVQQPVACACIIHAFDVSWMRGKLTCRVHGTWCVMMSSETVITCDASRTRLCCGWTWFTRAALHVYEATHPTIFIPEPTDALKAGILISAMLFLKAWSC